VTVPHKERVAALLDALSDEARATAAVNTIAQREGRLLGSNTDIDGFAGALREDGGFDPAGARVCVLGAGGAARAVVYALLRDGAAGVTIANRTTARAQALRAAIAPDDPRLSLAHGDPSSATLASDLIVNCTTLGMAHSDAADRSPLPEVAIPTGAFVFDVVANPLETPLLAAAHRRGCRTLGGLSMLVRQGAAAFTLWTGRPAPLDVMFAAAREAMAGHR
jgi:shikimate dehydrogenase